MRYTVRRTRPVSVAVAAVIAGGGAYSVAALEQPGWWLLACLAVAALHVRSASLILDLDEDGVQLGAAAGARGRRQSRWVPWDEIRALRLAPDAVVIETTDGLEHRVRGGDLDAGRLELALRANAPAVALIRS